MWCLLKIPGIVFPTQLIMCCLFGCSNKLNLSQIIQICNPVPFIGRTGQATWLVVTAIQISHVSRKARLYGSDLSSLSLYTRDSKLQKTRQTRPYKRIYSLANKGNPIKNFL